MKRILSVAAFSAATLLAASCANNATHEAALRAQQASLDSMKHELAKQRIIDSMQAVAAAQETTPAESVTVVAVPATTVAAAPARRSTRARSYSSSGSNYSSYSGSAPASSNRTVVYEPAPAQKKRGWSAKAKGAVIGGAAGAASGAIVNKRNRAGGAVIGGVLGAAAGTGVGAIIDRKNGR